MAIYLQQILYNIWAHRLFSSTSEHRSRHSLWPLTRIVSFLACWQGPVPGP